MDHKNDIHGKNTTGKKVLLYSTDHSYSRPYSRPEPQSHINGQPAFLPVLLHGCFSSSWGFCFSILRVVCFCAARFKSQRVRLWCWAVSSTTFSSIKQLRGTSHDIIIHHLDMCFAVRVYCCTSVQVGWRSK